MYMRIGRCLPPAAAPVTFWDIFYGLQGLCRGKSELDRFKNELREYSGSQYCFLVSSGKAALTVILQALKEISPDRDEVLIPAFCCYSVPSAIIRAGLKVRLCDVAPGSFDFDYHQLPAIIAKRKERLLCVVPVHLFGIPADIGRIRGMIDDGNIFIVEDAAQAMGGEYRGKKLGTCCDVGFFSLGRGKALTTIEGGIILTQRADIAERIESAVSGLRDYALLDLVKLAFYALALSVLLKPALFWLPKGLPFLRLGDTIYDTNFKMRKMSALQAGFARGWEKKLRRLKRIRSENVRGLLIRIGIRPPWAENDVLPDLLRFPLIINSTGRKETILRMSEKAGMGIACSYPDSIDRIPELKSYFDSHHFPAAKENASKLVTLPVHPYLTVKDMDKIADLLLHAE
jgi:dTDP-4-amino-4,6-dideoxygalactose transaminase